MPYQPTRLPYGVSYVKPSANLFNQSQQIIIQNSASTLYATPDCSLGSYWIAANSGLITNLRGGEQGKLLYIYCSTGGVVVLQNSVGGISFNNIVGTVSNNQVVTVSATAGNITMLGGETLEFVHNGTGWAMVGNRFVLSTQV